MLEYTLHTVIECEDLMILAELNKEIQKLTTKLVKAKGAKIEDCTMSCFVNDK